MSRTTYPRTKAYYRGDLPRTNAAGSLYKLSSDHYKGRYGYPDHNPVPTWETYTEWHTTGRANPIRMDYGRGGVTTDKYRVRAFAKKYGIDISGDFDLMTKAEQEKATQP